VPEPHMEELDQDECRRLAERHLGRLAAPDLGGPVIFPVNYVFDQGLVVFRTDPGSKLDAATEREQVAFEVDAVEEATRTGWSVVVRGTLAEITDPSHLARLRALPLYPWAPGREGQLRARPAGPDHRPPPGPARPRTPAAPPAPGAVRARPRSPRARSRARPRQGEAQAARR
jgi:uncharacterized protein